MVIDKFSKKQGEIFKFIYRPESALICDGAVRSGKTLSMSIAFLLWAMDSFNKTNFIVSGKTVASTVRNIILPLFAVEGLSYKLDYKTSKMLMTVKLGKSENYFYVFGGRDESSYTLVQGLTVAGILFDEVALMPQSFVEQAIARTLTFPSAKLWFNCNPDSPNHWFYKEWILKLKEHNARHLHFLMDDNPIMTRAAIETAAKNFSGVFYYRYIQGLWKIADGLIYRRIADNPQPYIINRSELPHIRSNGKDTILFDRINIGVDFGGNKSQHAFTASGFTPELDKVYVLRAKSIPATGTSVDDILDAFVEFAAGIERDYGAIDTVFADSAEQAIINSLRAHTKYPIRDSIKNEIIDRIRCEDVLISQKRIFFVEGECDDLIEGMSQAAWDPKSQKDKRLDDGTSNIDIMDSFEYSFEQFIIQLLGD